MISFLSRRVAYTALTLLLVSFVSFVIIQAAPGDYAEIVAAQRAATGAIISAADVQAVLVTPIVVKPFADKTETASAVNPNPDAPSDINRLVLGPRIDGQPRRDPTQPGGGPIGPRRSCSSPRRGTCASLSSPRSSRRRSRPRPSRRRSRR